MSNITDWIKYELYPSLFESIDRAFPEHDFKRYPGGWRSKTYLNSQPHKSRADKTVVTKMAPGLILEQGGECLSLIDYTMRSKGVEFIQAVEYLAGIAGLQIPKGDFSQVETSRKKQEILEAAASYLSWALWSLPGAQPTRDYLLQSRGYSEDEVKAMELGYIDSHERLFNRLQELGYSQDEVKEALALDSRIGRSHTLSIPYRSGGSIKGFKFRAIGAETPKYLNTPGLDKQGGFFNLLGIKGDKDVVIVEGELDALHATAKGLENVVAAGGSSISSEQIKNAVRRGARSFTICFDTEPGKEEETFSHIKKASEVILAEGVNRVYVVILQELGGQKTDPDSLVKELGIEAFKTAIQEARPYWEAWLQQLVDKYDRILKERGLEPRDKDNFVDEVVETGAQIPDPLDRDQYKKAFVDYPPIQELGITQESLDIAVERLVSTREKVAQETAFKQLLSKANELQAGGKTDKALELLDKQLKEVKLKDKATEFSSLLKPILEDELKERQANRPESLSSGYFIDQEELLLPAGAISILAAPTSHGKTTFLINLALNVVKAYPGKETYLFSYEEDADSVLINALNTYIGEELSTNNRKTLKTYFSTGSKEYIKSQSKGLFTANKDRFFKELIETRRLNILYSNYNSDALIDAIRYLHKNANPGAIFIDYIQLLNLPKGKYKTYSRQEEIKEICIALKDVAVETGLPIILGAQFNREVINQLRIHATKIGEAGDIERIANLIVGFWNNAFKPLAADGDLNEINQLLKGADKNGSIYATILKNRGGRVGGAESLSFNGNTGKISNSKKQADPF